MELVRPFEAKFASKGSAAFGGAQRAAAAWLCQACAVVVWSIISSRALKAVQYAEMEVGAMLSGVAFFHAWMVATAILFTAAAAGLLMAALLYRSHIEANHGHHEHFPAFPIWETFGVPVDSPGRRNAVQGTGGCPLPVVCTTMNVVYVGFMIWVCVCVFGYARWMEGASAVVEGAEYTLLRNSDMGMRTTMKYADEALAASVVSSGVEYRSNNGGGSSSESTGSADAASTCPATCLDLNEYDFLHTTLCVCDTAMLQGLYNNAAALYNQLLAALTLLLVMYGSAGVGLIYTSALLTRADGRSELDLVMDEGDRFVSAPADAPLPAWRRQGEGAAADVLVGLRRLLNMGKGGSTEPLAPPMTTGTQPGMPLLAGLSDRPLTLATKLLPGGVARGAYVTGFAGDECLVIGPDDDGGDSGDAWLCCERRSGCEHCKSGGGGMDAASRMLPPVRRHARSDSVYDVHGCFEQVDIGHVVPADADRGSRKQS